MDSITVRQAYATQLRAMAEQRFGAARAEALGPVIEDVAWWMAVVATFPVDPDEAPAFYAEPGS